MQSKKLALLLGSRLTKELIQKIGHESNIRTNEAVFLVSVGETGFPNVALLSYLDISIVSTKRLLLAIGENSSSKRNLMKTGRGTLVFWLGKSYGLYYAKGKFKLVRERLQSAVEGFTCSAFSMSVEALSKDHSNKARLLSTVTYESKKTNSAHIELFTELNSLSKSV